MNERNLPPNATPATALVVGGGLVGLCSALALQRAGVATVLIDRDAVRRGASWGNAGHIAVEQLDPLASWATIRSLPRRLFWRGGALALPLGDIAAWAPFSLKLVAAARPSRFRAGRAALSGLLAEALPAWRRALAAAGEPGLLREDGHFILWEREATANAGRRAWHEAETGTARIRDARPAELAMLRRLLRVPVAGAVRCEGSGHVADTAALAEALARAFAAAGGVQRQAEVEALLPAGAGAEVRLLGGERLSADLIVLAAGAASGQLLKPLGEAAPIIAERGYHIEAPASRWPADMPPVVLEDRSMIVTRFRETLRAASFVEFGRAESPPDPAKWRRLESHARAAGLPFDAPPMPWMGSRPTLPDYLPAIGRSRRAANLIHAFGHQHLGLTLAAVTGEAVAALATGATPSVELGAFHLARFGKDRK